MLYNVPQNLFVLSEGKLEVLLVALVAARTV